MEDLEKISAKEFENSREFRALIVKVILVSFDFGVLDVWLWSFGFDVGNFSGFGVIVN